MRVDRYTRNGRASSTFRMGTAGTEITIRRQGRKTPHNSCRVACWKWSAFYAIAVLLELLDHSGNARALRFGAHRRTPFLVADPLMQNHPEQSVKSVGDRPDGLFVS